LSSELVILMEVHLVGDRSKQRFIVFFTTAKVIIILLSDLLFLLGVKFSAHSKNLVLSHHIMGIPAILGLELAVQVLDEGHGARVEAFQTGCFRGTAFHLIRLNLIMNLRFYPGKFIKGHV
jgi:hypothetical protein